MSKALLGIAFGGLAGALISGVVAGILGAGFPLHAIALGALTGAGPGGFAGFVLSGNRSVQTATPELKRQALQFERSKMRAVCFVFRDAFFGFLAGIDLLVDGQTVGQTRGRTFLRVEMDPGQHTLVSRHSGSGIVNGTQQLTARPGELYFFRQNVGRRNGLAPCNERVGMRQVRKCRMLAGAL